MARWGGTAVGAIMIAGLAAAGTAVPVAAQQAGGPADRDAPVGVRVDLAVQPDEAVAVLAILEARAAGEAVPAPSWASLESAEGFRRMVAREQYMDREYGRNSGYGFTRVRRWLRSDAALEDLDGRREGLRAWQEVDIDAPAAMAMAYLPETARLRGTIYPIIREWTNSFIFELDGPNPGIFMYVEPGLDARSLEHILAHEFHHMGLISGCAHVDRPALPVLRVLSGFGEGYAVLAAAGGPDGETHPLEQWSDVREAWGRRIDSLAVDMAEVESFLLDVMDGRVPDDDLGRRAMRFSSRGEAVPQGPFYSVGWHMARTVERELGRQTLIDGMCHKERLFLDYDRAARAINARDRDAGLPLWSPELIERLRRLDG